MAAMAAGVLIWLKKDDSNPGSNTMAEHLTHSETSKSVSIDLEGVDVLKSGEPHKLAFKLSNGATVLQRADLSETHEKLLHFVVVDEGLTDFKHLHPTLAGDGTWTQPVTLQHGGPYLFFAEGQAKGGSFVARKEVKVAGALNKDAASFAVSLTSKVGTSEAKILNPEALMTEMDSSVRVHVTPADGWEPYLGAPGHLILINKEARSSSMLIRRRWKAGSRSSTQPSRSRGHIEVGLSSKGMAAF